MILDPNQPFVDKAQRLSSWGHWFTFFNILLALLISTRYIATDALPTTVLGFVYLVTNWIGHTAFITFILFVLTIFPLSLIFPYPRHIRGMGAVIATSGMILLFIDAYSYSRLGYHISASSLEQVVGLLTNTWHHHPVRSFMWVFGISSLILLYELLISNFTWKRLDALKEKAYGRKVAVFFLSAFTLSHLIHIYADATLDYDVTQQNNMFVFSYPATAKTLLAKNGLLDKQEHQAQQAHKLALRQNLDYRPPHREYQCNASASRKDLVVLLSSEVPDNDTRLKLDQTGFVRFNKHYVPSNHENAVFDLLYGLPSIYKQSVIANRIVPEWIEQARQQGVTVNIDFASNPELMGYEYINDSRPQNQGQSTLSLMQVAGKDLVDTLATLANHQVILLSLDSARADAAGNAVVKAPMWVKWSDILRYKGQVTQNLDFNTTVLESWLGCPPILAADDENPLPQHFGKNLLFKRPKVLAANYTDGTIVSIKKDKITLLDDQGNALQISAANGYKLSQGLDIPALNDTIHMLKRYSGQ